MTIPERAAQIAVTIANDDRHGYSQANRYGTLEGGDFDCSSLVIYCYHRAFMEFGISPTPQNAGASYTGNMLAGFTRCGFKSFRDDHGSGLQVGDVLLNEARHTAIVCSLNPVKVVNARGDIDGVAGDSTGTEIRIQPYWSYPWDWVLRLASNSAEIGGNSSGTSQSTSNSSTVGQQMAQQVINARYTPDTEAVKENMLVPVLELYLQGKSVEAMQSLLILRKIDIGPDGADGYFGSKTYKGLCEFQTSLGRVSGKCDAYTWDKLIKGADGNDSADN